MKTKNIKKLTELFALIVTMLCTLAAGVVFLTASASTANAETAPVTENFATAWAAAVSESIDTNTEVEFKLGGNWEASSNGSFGSDVGFTSGEILVPKGANIILDLNGYSISRGFNGGRVITVQGTLTLTDTSGEKDAGGYDKGKITGGYVTGNGGGVDVDNGKFIMNGGTIYNNRATSGGGVRVGEDGAEFTMNGGAIVANQSIENAVLHTGGEGGGVRVFGNSKFVMNGGSISGNEAPSNGGSVYIEKGTFEMNGGTILNNKAKSNGGGVYLTGEIASFEMNGGIIRDNTAKFAGGVYMKSGTFQMTDGTIRDNTADSGGGVFVAGGTFTMNNGIISSNIVDFENDGCGGGVYVCSSDNSVSANCEFIMSGGSISGHKASLGGGVYVDGLGGTTLFEMSGGTISENNAQIMGGGVYVCGNGVFKMSGGTIGGKNEAVTGGGVAVYNSTFLMEKGAQISDNTGYVAGAFVQNGTFTMTGGAIKNNKINNSTPSSSYQPCGALVYGNTDFKVSGNPRISGNLTDGDGDPRNLLMLGNDSNPAQMTVTGELDGAEIWVGGNPCEVLTKDYFVRNNGVAPLNFFHSDKGKLILPTGDNKEAYISFVTGLVLPELSETSFVYDGKPKTVSVSGSDKDFITVTGDLSGTNAGSYKVTVSINDKTDYGWFNGSTDAVELSWTITRAPAFSGELATPADLERSDDDQNFAFNYGNLNVELPEGWTMKNGVITVPGGTAAGEYTLTVTPKDNYCWADGSISAKTLTVTVRDVLSREMLIFIIVGSTAIALYTAGTAVNITLIRKDKKKLQEENGASEEAAGAV